jgi:hypothetical protein
MIRQRAPFGIAISAAAKIALLSGAAIICSAVTASAQSARDLVGVWEPVSIVNTSKDGVKSEPFGPNLRGITFFGADGRFSQIVTRPGIPKFASDNRMQGTPEENKAVVQSSIAYFGTYSVSDKVLILHVEGGTWTSWTGTDQKRPITSFTNDQMTLTLAAAVGGTNETVWRRLK